MTTVRTQVIGLTGGIAMGKSTVAGRFERRGLPVVDSDVLARQVVEPGQPALDEIREQFGAEVMDGTGRMDRAAMARRVFTDEGARRALEAILHPRIREAWQREAQGWRQSGRPAGVVVIPLLFETDAGGEFDTVVCVACTASSQQQRLADRGWSAEMAAARVHAQWPVSRKMALASHVIWTEGDLRTSALQVDRVLTTLGLLPTIEFTAFDSIR